MKILVIEDGTLHQEAAKAQLVAHDLVVVGTYEQGEKLLRGEQPSRKEIDDQLSAWGVADDDPQWDQAYCRAEDAARSHGFEVVLVDLMLPASGRSQALEGEKFVGQEMPIGIFLALLAAKHGAKFVGLLTDMNHHRHPASACLDPFIFPLTLGSVKFVMMNDGVGEFSKEDLSKDLSFEEALRLGKENIVRVKNWAYLLKRLTATT